MSTDASKSDNVEVLKSYDPDSPQYTINELRHEIDNIIKRGGAYHMIVIAIGPRGRALRFGSDDPEGMTNADILWYLEMAKYSHLGLSTA
jgi:hypothetical protein